MIQYSAAPAIDPRSHGVDARLRGYDDWAYATSDSTGNSATTDRLRPPAFAA
jgi:hypothetical protein